MIDVQRGASAAPTAECLLKTRPSGVTVLVLAT